MQEILTQQRAWQAEPLTAVWLQDVFWNHRCLQLRKVEQGVGQKNENIIRARVPGMKKQPRSTEEDGKQGSKKGEVDLPRYAKHAHSHASMKHTLVKSHNYCPAFVR